jgi:hypothetical protein
MNPAVKRPGDALISTLANAYTCYGRRGDKDGFLVAILSGYFDESGTHEGDHLCVVSGFVGNDAQWGAFINDWVPAIKPRLNLHMRKLKWKKYLT